ncbi:hypothetical protein BY996DRAFT_8003632 [Phakopsora pachyrhizi]|nr:hypothetical protein BY996DRAFT_8003632 [Phakopsora pachyrhizi]
MCKHTFQALHLRVSILFKALLSCRNLHAVSADYFVLILIILFIVKGLLNFIVISISFIIAHHLYHCCFLLYFFSELNYKLLKMLYVYYI